MDTIELLNQNLIDEYGIDTETSQPLFRVVWSDDQLEKRLVYELASGVQLLHPMVMEVKKYSYLKHLYVLERLVVVPEDNRRELGDIKLSYEPVWVYKDVNNQPLPPVWIATKVVVDVLYAALGKKSMRKYVEDESETTKEGREQKIDKIVEELFGDETETGDALAYGEAIVVPPNYKKVN